MKRRLFVQRSATLVAAISSLPAAALTTTGERAAISAPGTENNSQKDHMESEALKTVVRRFNKEVIEEGRRASFLELMDTAFVNRSAPAGAPDGPESMWNTFENVLRPALSNLKVEICDQLCEGEKVTTRKRLTGTHTGTLMGVAPTGKSVSIDVIDIVRVQGGRYAEHWGINTLPSVLAQLRAN